MKILDAMKEPNIEAGLDWIVITGLAGRQIGALGFINNKVAVIASFYDDRDGNMDGKVSFGEKIVAAISPISLSGMAVTTVAMAAANDEDVYQRDPDFRIVAAHMFQNFARGLIVGEIYLVYLSNSVSSVVSSIVGRISTNIVTNFIIRKGMEGTVKQIYNSSILR